MPVAAAPEVIRPAFLWVPPIASESLGGEAAELAEQLDQEVREEERIALRALMPVKANGMPAGLESGIVAGRQQIKTWAMRQALIHDAWVTKVARCMWSAHRTKTSDDTFEELVSLVNSFDWLRRRVRRIYSGNGNHKIVFNDKLTTYPTLGAAGRQKIDRTVEFGARENGPTGRGRTKINRLTLDEWLMGTSAMKGAQVPMMGAAGDRYIRYGSSAGLLMSADLRGLRGRGRMGVVDPTRGDPSLTWCEWTSERVNLVIDEQTGRARLVRVLPSCEEPDCTHIAGQVNGCRLDNVEIIRAACPAYGTARLSEEFVAQERLTLPPVEYGRERAGIWEDPPEEAAEVPNLFPKWDDRVLPLDALGRALGSPRMGRPAIGIDTSWDRQTTWIGAATPTELGFRVELVSVGRGTDWVLQWLLAPSGEPVSAEETAPEDAPPRVARPIAVAMQGSGAPVSGLADELEQGLPDEYRGRIRRLTGAEMAKSGAKVYDLVDKGQIEVVGHPKLTAAVASRPMGDGWVIDRRASKADAAPIVAVCAAVWALLTEPEADDDYDVMDSIG